MSDHHINDPDELLPSRYLCNRYKITPKTLRDWERDHVLPPAERINNRKYWRRRVLEEAERVGMSRKKSVEAA
jgi:DNA-binding transcriptional MerR regulator